MCASDMGGILECDDASDPALGAHGFEKGRPDGPVMRAGARETSLQRLSKRVKGYRLGDGVS